jgi:hypothetical protein
MSPSSSPVRDPMRARATARLTATVDLPTPPLPAPMASTCFTSGRGLCASGSPWPALRTSAENSTVTAPTLVPCSSALSRIARSMSSRIVPFSGQAGVVSSTATVTSSPSTLTPFTMPRVTRSLPSSGSWTVRRMSWTCSLVRGIGGSMQEKWPAIIAPGRVRIAGNMEGGQVVRSRDRRGALNRASPVPAPPTPPPEPCR